MAAVVIVAAVIAIAANARASSARQQASGKAGLVMTARGRMPLAEALAHFRAGLPEVAHLESGTTQRDTLVRRFLVAVERRDTTTIRSLLLSRAEFAYLYFPHSVFSRRPYRQDPALAWFLSQQ
ncbi:MAG TPA: hypothetical protein VJ596_12145, partial [Gemmatimonadaceae bacterium]|nr:hypothetical protein [Gemmatimonadaceae bacterium]